MFQNLLFPTDLSEESWSAWSQVRVLAESFHSDVHVLAVVEDSFVDLGALYEGAAALPAFEEHVEGLKERARASLEARLMNDGRGLRYRIHVVRAPNPKQVILAFLKEYSVDLVVMATHGRRGVQRLLLGSTTEAVIRSAGIPVLTVPARAGSTPGESL